MPGPAHTLPCSPYERVQSYTKTRWLRTLANTDEPARFCGSAGSVLKEQEGVVGAGEPLPRQQGTRAALWCAQDGALETHSTKAAWTRGEAQPPHLSGGGAAKDSRAVI